MSAWEVTKWTCLSMSPVTSRGVLKSTGPQAWPLVVTASPCTVRCHVQRWSCTVRSHINGGLGHDQERSLCSKVQCIVAKGHIGPPMGWVEWLTAGQTWLKTLPSQTFWQVVIHWSHTFYNVHLSKVCPYIWADPIAVWSMNINLVYLHVFWLKLLHFVLNVGIFKILRMTMFHLLVLITVCININVKFSFRNILSEPLQPGLSKLNFP